MVTRTFTGSQLLRALAASGAHVNLHAFTGSDNLNGLRVKLYGLDAASGLDTPINSTPAFGNEALVVFELGSQGAPFLQEPGTLNLLVAPRGDANKDLHQESATGALITKPDPGLSDTVTQGGATGAPTGNSILATVTPGVTGNWQITCIVGVLGTFTTNDLDNMFLQKNAVTVTVLPNPTGSMVVFGPYRRALVNTDTLTIRSISPATAGTFYLASLIATQTG